MKTGSMKTARPQLPVRSLSGFTLIEVLFAVLVFAIVLAAINTVFYGSLRLRERADVKQKELMPRLQALEQLKRDLRAAFYSKGFRADRFRAEPSRGLGVPADHIQFFAASGTTDEFAPWPDVQQVEYYLAAANSPSQDRNRLELVRAITRNFLIDTYQPPVKQRLVSGVSAFQLAFFDGEIWTPSWDSELQDPVLPKAVQIQLEFAPANHNSQPPPALTQNVSILAEPKIAEDEKAEAPATGGDSENNAPPKTPVNPNTGRALDADTSGGRTQE